MKASPVTKSPQFWRAGAAWVLGFMSLTLGTPRSAQGAPPGSEEAGKEPSAEARPAGTVLTFYGLRKLEQDPNVSDAEKVREWRAFIQRSAQQVEYARKAVDRWKNAEKLRLVESAKLADADDEFSLRQRIAQWTEVVRTFPKAPEAARARKRITDLRDLESARLVQEAEEVEASGATKVDRIRAWLSVIAWAPKSRPARAAERRVEALQKQLYSEAESVDRIERLDDQTKLEAWQDVLRGHPTPRQRRKAEQRVQALEEAVAG